ncbi:MAG TPA: hypothetical protein VLL48_11745, partial [Longimicrobiales bacterium]|nr:hypothetical protein [Longimicrobiales bacterium]
MIVHKFGGTSLEDGVRIRAAAELVREAGTPTVVVVSAMAGVTDALQGLADAARSGSPSPDAPCDELARRHLAALGSLAEGGGAGDAAPGRGPDSAAGRAPSWTGGALTEAGSAGRTAGEAIEERIAGLREALAAVAPEGPEAPDPLGIHEVLAAGEDLSVILMVRALSLLGIDAVGVDARSVIRTDASSGAAVPRDQETWDLVRGRLGPLLQAGRTPVLQGFVGATAEGRTTTLGRGGSDFTAAIVGAVLDAREVVIWTDVDGIFSADPRVADDARILPEMGYEEAVELAYFGAKVVHPAAAKHAVARDVTLRIRNALRPGAVGTRIRCDVREARGVAAVAYKRSVTLISVRSLPL